MRELVRGDAGEEASFSQSDDRTTAMSGRPHRENYNSHDSADHERRSGPLLQTLSISFPRHPVADHQEHGRRFIHQQEPFEAMHSTQPNNHHAQQQHDSSGYAYHQPLPSGPVMAPTTSSDGSYANHSYAAVPYTVIGPHHTASSFESHGSAMSGPYVMGGPGHVVTYSYGPHPGMIAYPGYPHQQTHHYPPTWMHAAPPPKIDYVKNIKPTDVLCGRGGATNCKKDLIYLQ